MIELTEVVGSSWDMPTLNVITEKGLQWTTTIGVFLVTSFFGLKLGIEYFRYSLSTLQGNEVSVMWDWNEILRAIFIVILIGGYYPLAEGVSGAIRSINAITEKDSSINQELQANANMYFVHRKALTESPEYAKLHEAREFFKSKGESEVVEGLNKELNKMAVDLYSGEADGTITGSEVSEEQILQNTADIGMFDFKKHFEAALMGFANLVSDLIKLVMGWFLKFVFMIGIVFGPIALAFGIFFKDKPIQFFNLMLTLGFSFTTLNILDMLMLYFQREHVIGSGVAETFAFALIQIGCYFSVFKMTSWFIGTVGMNSIMSAGMGKVAGAAAAGVMVAGAAATGGKSLMAGSKGAAATKSAGKARPD